ncbi:MAG: 16S rRNA (uracil(1498)-N(3))-methyltransferase [Candidatus Omnitrophica bacterium]|nr:16S rRNA (uracil(1498)-N(3))-methyltransferase [Candidatus Omnitrophota bacterium]
MQRLFTNSKNISESVITITETDQINHLKNALRLKVGDKIAICDDKGFEYLSKIDKLSKELIVFVIEVKKRALSSKQYQFTVACAIPKQSKMDEIIDKLTQLGVYKIIPLLTERVVVKLDKSKERLRLERWRKVALSAAGQSQRSTLPLIDPVKSLPEVLVESNKFGLKLIPTLSGVRKSLVEVFAKSRSNNMLFFIGPEGDFTDQEVRSAIEAGCIPITLGDLVLRVDTAAIAVASFISLYQVSG